MNDMAQVLLASLDIPAQTDGASHWSGTRALMLAVLEDAILNLGSAITFKRAEAERWIMSPEHGYVFSFAVICETLNLSPTAVRRSLIRLLDQKPQGRRLLRRARGNVRHAEPIHRHSARQSRS